VNRLFAAALEVQAFCVAHKWKLAIIGGLAVQRWGEPRQTRDVYVTLLTGLGGEEKYVDAILDQFPARLPSARAFALERRVLLVETGDGTPIDISLGGLPYEARVVGRASAFAFEEGAAITTCSAEDLVVLKAFADRPQDWLDIEGVVVRQGVALNRALVLDELGPLLDLKEDLSAAAKLRTLFDTHIVHHP
jgi:hypothetical protein